MDTLTPISISIYFFSILINNLIFRMEERAVQKPKKSKNPFEDRLSSQVKRIEEILKSGEISWPRVKSAYTMADAAINQLGEDIKGVYPIKQYTRLVQLIFSQFLGCVEDDSEEDPSSKIKSKLAGSKKPKGKTPNKQGSEKDVESSLNQFKNQDSGILERLSISNESLVETELKKVIQSLDSVKTSLIDELVRGENKRNQIISQDLKIELNDVLGEWKQEIQEKYRELSKWLGENKQSHSEALKRKDQEISKLLQDGLRRGGRSHCGVQTVEEDRNCERKLVEKEIEFNLEKDRFLRVTKVYQKQLLQLKKYTKSLRTSSHLKLQECEKSILDLNRQIKHVKGEFREYFQGNREADQLFFNIYQKHQKTRTPFIPKSDIHEVYQKLKSKQRKQSTIISIFQEEEKTGENSKKEIKSRDQNSRSNKHKKQLPSYNDPLIDVKDIPSKINNFQTASKLRNSIKMISKNPSFIVNREDSLPLIKMAENPYVPSSQNIKSLHEPKLITKNQINPNYLSVLNINDRDLPSKMSSRKNMQDFYRQNISNSLYVENTNSSLLKSPSREQKRISIRPVIKPLSRQRGINDSELMDTRKQKLEQLGVDKSNKKCSTESNEVEKQCSGDSDDQTMNYVIKINKVDEEQEMEVEEKKKPSRNQTYTHKSKTIYVQNPNSSVISTIKSPKGHRDTNKQFSYHREKEGKERQIRQGKENKQIRDIREVREIREIKENKEMKQAGSGQRVRNKQKKANTNVYPNIKQATMGNFEREMSSLFQKYQKIQNYDQYNQDIEDGIEKVKKYHKMACTKHICHHLRKFEDRLKRIKHQNCNKRPLKLGRLDIRHDSL